MEITRVIVGFVTQVYDTKKKKFISQEFTGGEESWEKDGESLEELNIEEPNLGFMDELHTEMVQPGKPLEERILSMLETQPFRDFYEGEFVEYIEDPRRFKGGKEKIIKKIKDLLK